MKGHEAAVYIEAAETAGYHTFSYKIWIKLLLMSQGWGMLAAISGLCIEQPPPPPNKQEKNNGTSTNKQTTCEQPTT